MRPKHTYTAEQDAFIRENAIGVGNQELTDRFNARFGTDVPVNSIKAFKANRGISSGLDGRFRPGNVPFNKGKPFRSGGRSIETQFKKGQTPINFRPVGSERISKDGYIEVKVADPSKWRLKQRIVWEEVNGPVPRGYALIFLDSNPLNVDIENLYMVSRGELAVLNKLKQSRELDRESTLAMLHVVKLHMAANQQARSLKKKRGKAHVSELTEEDYRKAAEKGLSRTQLAQRVFKLGWSVHRAIHDPIRPQKRKEKKGEEDGLST